MSENPDPFREEFLAYFDLLQAQISMPDGSWTVKGFIDVYRRVYAISLDTKVLSKVLELLLLPVIQQFAIEHRYEIRLARSQNQYPDLSLISHETGLVYAVDVKTTYRRQIDRSRRQRVNGMTLGTFQGYFRNRSSTNQSTFPYERYHRHYVLGLVYSQTEALDELTTYMVEDLENIPSVAYDFVFFLHEKYCIASDRPGSGNTKNIGATIDLEKLIAGQGPFATLGIDVFDDYWMNYRTREMAVQEGLSGPPYRNLVEYRDYKARGAEILSVPREHIDTEDDS